MLYAGSNPACPVKIYGGLLAFGMPWALPLYMVCPLYLGSTPKTSTKFIKHRKVLTRFRRIEGLHTSNSIKSCQDKSVKFSKGGKMKKGFTSIEMLVVVIILISVIGGVIFWVVGSFNNQITPDITVADKMVQVHDKEGKYLIYTKVNGEAFEVYENTDNLLRGKFNSSDVYNQIEIGKTYRFRVVGFRIPFLSMYKNILEVTEIKTEDSLKIEK